MRKILCVLLALFVLGSAAVPAFAKEPMLLDVAELIGEETEAALAEEMRRVLDTYGAEIVLVTMPLIDGDIEDAAEKLYDDAACGMGEDRAGVLLLVSMDPREYYVFCNGFAWDRIDTDEVCDAIYSDMVSGDYAAAFERYLQECAAALGKTGGAAGIDYGKILLISVGIGLAVGLIYVLILKGQLKTVRGRSEASSYVRAGSMNLTRSGDYFMYRNVTRMEKPKQNSSGSSSSRGGSGRSF